MNNIKLYKLKYFGVEPGEGRSVCYPSLILKGNKILFLNYLSRHTNSRWYMYRPIYGMY